MGWHGPSGSCGCCGGSAEGCCPDRVPLRVQFVFLAAVGECTALDGTYLYDIDQDTCQIGTAGLVTITASGGTACDGDELRLLCDLADPGFGVGITRFFDGTPGTSQEIVSGTRLDACAGTVQNLSAFGLGRIILQY